MIEKIKSKIVVKKQRIIAMRALSSCKKGNFQRVAEMRLADLSLLSGIDKKAFCEIQDEIIRLTAKRLHEAEKVRVAFVLYSASMWSCGDLYRIMERDGRFEPYVVVAKYTNDSNTETWPTFHMATEFFKREKLRYIEVPDSTNHNRGWEAMGKPDIVFYLTPYHTLLPVGVNQGYLPSKVITIYIPYSYMLIKAEEKYNLPAFRYSWRHYCDSEIYRKILLDYNPLYVRNTFFVGYPKMDPFYNDAVLDDSLLWKLGGKSKRKIIYSPHHSLRDLDYCSSHFSTFDMNGKFILELAKKYSDTTSWIYKPHPNLKKTVLMAGVYESEEEYEEYVAQWEALPNARVVRESTYVDYFKTSDAMICDSVSFLAEYQFTGKPLLLLTRPEQSFNPMGEKVQSVLYKCPGEDFAGIERFVTDVVVSGNDRMKSTRDDFFKENLDYYCKNGSLTASERIYAELRGFCFGEISEN